MNHQSADNRRHVPEKRHNDLKTEIQNLDVSDIANLDKVSEFTGNVTNTLEAAKNLLLVQADEVEDVLSIASVVTSLPSLDDIRAEITGLLDAINAHLNSLKPA